MCESYRYWYIYVYIYPKSCPHVSHQFSWYLSLCVCVHARLSVCVCVQTELLYKICFIPSIIFIIQNKILYDIVVLWIAVGGSLCITKNMLLYDWYDLNGLTAAAVNLPAVYCVYLSLYNIHICGRAVTNTMMEFLYKSCNQVYKEHALFTPHYYILWVNFYATKFFISVQKFLFNNRQVQRR